jgi:hypothetical protein
MGQALERLVYCTGPNVAKTPKYRRDPDGRGVWHWCRGHHREELDTWEEMGLTREVLEQLLQETRQ